ncbi:MAG: lycopene cyclase, partial [Flavobacteriaceae bacterium]
DFIKKERPLNDFKTRNKYNFYDNFFIDVLAQYNEKGGDLFKNLFKQNKHLTIFKFLDEEASLWDDLKIMRSFPLLVFVKALFKRLF